jgi:hypothetical protein
MDQLNSRLRGDLPRLLRIRIGIHVGEAVVGEMGPPLAQVIWAIGQVVNVCGRSRPARFSRCKKATEATIADTQPSFEIRQAQPHPEKRAMRAMKRADFSGIFGS